MKTLNVFCLIKLIVFFVFGMTVMAQTQTVTLLSTNLVPSSYNCSTNQVITINSFISGGSSASADISFHNGLKSRIQSYTYGANSSSSLASSAVFTGATNISTVGQDNVMVAALTFTITTPAIHSTIPANAVVIPTDATGPVQIVLESSSDLINWVSCLPGTYGNTSTNRFFRARAIAQ